jgi:hypothetical protein
VLGASLNPATHRGILPPKNPSKSLRPGPFFLSAASCRHGGDGSACNSQLTPGEQLFATVNLERIERGLPPAVVLTRSLDKIAQRGATSDKDPPLQDVPDPLPGGGHYVGLGGNWAGGWGNALGADYGWMYDDGLGSDNGDCSKSHRSGCWGHRDNILGAFASKARCGGERSELAMGAGHVARGKAFGDSETELFAGVCGATPTDVVISWARVERLLHIKS